MTTLTPLILQNASLLRALISEGALPATVPGLVAVTERDASNLRKSLKALEADGLVQSAAVTPALGHTWRITDAGRAAVAALDRADNVPAAAPPPGDLPDGYAMLLHDEIAPDPLNPRSDFDAEGLEELAGSILADGLLENLVVRPADPGAADPLLHRLVAGERRWRAIGLLIARGQWAADQAIPCKVMDLDDAAHVRIALIENLQRRDLKPLEEARGFKRLIEEFGFTTATIAEKINFTQRLVQQRLQLLELPPIKQVELEAGKITIEDARRFLAAQPTLREDLTPADWLMLAEIAEVSARENDGDIFKPINCRLPDDDSADASWRPMAAYPRLISGPYAAWEEGVETGFATISLTPYGEGPEQLRLKFGDLKDAANRARHIAALRSEVLPEGLDLAAGVCATALLNGPFEITAEVRARIEAAAKEYEDRQARHRAESERRHAEQQNRADGYAKAAEIVRALPDNPPQRQSALLEAVQQTGHPLPWRYVEATEDDCGYLADADGRGIELDTYYEDLPDLMPMLVMAAVNALAGHAPVFQTPEEPADDPDAADDDDDSGQGGEGGAPAADTEIPPEDADAEIPGFLRRLAGADDEPQPEAAA